MLRFDLRCIGSSLVELMIAMSLGVSALSAFSAFIGFGVGVNANLLATSRLNEEFTLVFQLLARDIARAGFNGHASSQVIDPLLLDNNFTQTLVVGQRSGEMEKSCILFAYDRNANGVLDTQTTNEQYGYRLHNKAIEMRTDGARCDSGGWHDLTDPKVVEIAKLAFNVIQTPSETGGITQVEMTLSARLKVKPNISRQSTIRFMVNNHVL